MMFKKLLLVLPLVLSSSISSAQKCLTDSLLSNLNQMSLQQKVDTKELIRDYIDVSEDGNNNDAMLLQLYLEVNIPEEETEKYIKNQRDDGSWPDIDYQDQKRGGWNPSNHVTRIQALAKIYKTPTSRFYMSPVLSSVLHKAMNYWFRSKLKCPNWWYNQIGIPKLFGPAFLLLKDEISESEKNEALVVMNNSRIGMTGQNKVWLAGNVFMKALLISNDTLAKEARDAISSEIFISEKEGLQPDFSFHQHGAQMQFGNYGLAFLGTISYWARVFQGTSLALSPAKIELLRNFFTEGMRWPVWRGYLDVSASGRQVFANSQKGKSYSVSVSAVNMIEADTTKTTVYKGFLYHNQMRPSVINDLLGNRFFWRSDYGVQREPNWFSSVRMNSSRTIGFEMTNKENLQGAFSADGVMITMVDGGEYDNIYPVWDWKRLPGLTIADDGSPIRYQPESKPTNKSDFVGGVSDKCHAVYGMTLDRKGIKANKSYFVSDDMIVCLGSNISSPTKDAHLFTTVDQRILPASGISYAVKNKILTVPIDQQVDCHSVKWIHAGKTGYVMLSPSQMNISSRNQTGSWSKIAVFYNDNQTVTLPVMEAVISHQRQQDESYAYCVVPDVDLAKMKIVGKATSKNIDFVNTKDLQAVYFKSYKMWQAVFFSPGDYRMGKQIITVDQPCIMMIKEKENSLVFYLADPTQKLDKITFHVKSAKMPLRTIDVQLPHGKYRGSTISETVPLI